jgi:hypothetical protein
MIFIVTGEQFNLGSHFLIWSIHHLSSQKKYYRQQGQSIETIPPNPLIDNTAHKMFTNHCRSIQSCQDTVEILSDSTNLNHIKFTPKKKTIEECNVEVLKCHSLMTANGIKVVNTTCNGLQHLIAFLRFSYQVANWQSNIDQVKEHCKHYWPHFFNNPEIYLDNLTSWHDIREGVAFNLRPNDLIRSSPERINGEMILHYKFEDLLLDGKVTIEKILKFLDLPYSDQILDDWCHIHTKWSIDLKHYIYFCNDIHEIVNNIVLERPMELVKYKMDVLKEGVLLHFLMFQHNLNLKTKIETLPTNTLEISKLLGKNNRTGLEKLYDNQ